MIIMALDHTRDMFHITALTQDPLNPETTTPILFFTRWVTHFCAPVFVFLTGTSVYLQSLRKSKKELGMLLLKRGLWLILVEVVIMSFALSFDPSYSFIFLAVIWAIGISLVLLSFLLNLPFAFIFIIGMTIVLGHNLLDYYEASAGQTTNIFYMLLHRQGFVPISGTRVLGILYPFLPWTGLMLLGYCFGRWFAPGVDDNVRKKSIAMTAAGLVILFIILRTINLYGDPSHWSTQKSSLYTFLSFINTTKYPPSLAFMLMTIGPALLFLAYAGPVQNRLTNIISTYGKVPFFYYVIHFFLIHIVSAIFTISRGHSFQEAYKGAEGIPFKFVFPGEGISLAGVYMVWLSVVIALYPLCKWFARYKATHRKWWLSYI